MKSVFTLLAAAVAVVAVAVEPELLEKRCSADTPQTWIIDEVYSIAKSRGVNSVVMLATFETASVESNWNNLNCGDQDSVGVFQQRPSQGWGNVGQLENVGYSTNAFLDVAVPLNKQHPGWSAGVLAQGVQGSERPDAYSQMESRAQSILSAAEARAGNGGSGGGGAVNVAPAPPKKGSSSSSSSKGSSSSSKTVGAPKNLASGTIKTGCKEYANVVKGNTCYALQKKYGITVSHFLSINKGVHSSCNNLQIGKAYCVKN